VRCSYRLRRRRRWRGRQLPDSNNDSRELSRLTLLTVLFQSQTLSCDGANSQSCPPLLAVSAYVTVQCPPVPSIDSSSSFAAALAPAADIDRYLLLRSLCRRRSSGQRRCCDPRRIDADLLLLLLVTQFDKLYVTSCCCPTAAVLLSCSVFHTQRDTSLKLQFFYPIRQKG